MVGLYGCVCCEDDVLTPVVVWLCHWWDYQADLVSNPKDIFKYLYQNRIGEHVSLFYVGWAWVLESTANYAQAHKVYLKATQKYVAVRTGGGGMR